MVEEYVLDAAIKMAIEAEKIAHNGVSGTRVGACAVAHTKEGKVGIFSGCNIELANSKGWHAEEVAMMKAISEGYPYLDAVIVTSRSESHQAAGCGYCLQNISYANLDCIIMVVDMKGNVKVQTTARERQGEHGYFGTGKLLL